MRQDRIPSPGQGKGARPETVRAGATLLALMLLGAATAPAVAAAATACATAETLASYPAPAFLENLTVEPSGRLLFTSYLAREIVQYRPGQGARRWSGLDSHPISIVPSGDGWLVAAHGVPFTAGPAFTTSNRFLLLDAAGTQRRTIPAPQARFLNGMAPLDDGSVLVADSILGRIWRLQPATGTLSAWLDAPELAGDPAGRDQRPGVNGLKRQGNTLYLSNSFTGRIHALPLAADGRPGGPLWLVASPGRVDDFAVAADGGIYLATHADTVLHATPAGRIRTVLPTGGDGSTAVALAAGDQQALYVLTSGGLLEGAGKPARLLRVPLPGAERMCTS
jgi:hypothetical protein